MNQGKEIDIIVPAYNRAPLIKTFLDQANQETYRPIKLYFALGESQDNTEKTLKELIPNYPNLDIHYHVLGSVSLGQLRNYWLDSSELKGDYLAFLDIDDSFDSTLIARLVSKTEGDQSDMVQCAFKRSDAKTGKVIAIDMAHNPKEAIQDPFSYPGLIYLHTGVPAKLFRLSVVDKDIRFWDSHRFEDVAFVLKFLAKAQRISFINDPLYDYKIHTGSVSRFSSKDELNHEMKAARDVLLSVKSFYQEKNPEVYSLGFVDALAFLRYGIGLTTRACLSGFVNSKQLIQESTQFLDTNFPRWRDPALFSKKVGKQLGKKTAFVRWCQHLYKHHHFRLFIWNYHLYTRLLKKDIKP